MPPITPASAPCPDQAIRRAAAFSRALVARQDEPTGTCSHKLHEPSRNELTATSLGIEQGADRFTLRQGEGALLLLANVGQFTTVEISSAALIVLGHPA